MVEKRSNVNSPDYVYGGFVGKWTVTVHQLCLIISVVGSTNIMVYGLVNGFPFHHNPCRGFYLKKDEVFKG